MKVIRKLKAAYVRFNEWGEQEKTRKNKHIVRNAMVASVAVGAIGYSLWNLSGDLRAQDKAFAIAATERVAQDLYEADVREYEACLQSVETRELYRKRFFASADSKQRLAEILDTAVPDDSPSQPLVDKFFLVVAAEFLGIETDLPSRRVEDCPDKPVPPTTPAATD